jgi:hypothetical protein
LQTVSKLGQEIAASPDFQNSFIEKLQTIDSSILAPSDLRTAAVMAGITIVLINGNWVKVVSAAEYLVLKAGDKTPNGYTLTQHAAENAMKRGFNLTRIDNVISNYSQKFYSYGEEIYCKKVGNFYDVVIKSRDGNNIVSTIGGNTHSLQTIKDIEKFLVNSGRTITTLPLD